MTLGCAFGGVPLGMCFWESLGTCLREPRACL